jgi:hypothetical protein
MEDSRAAKSGVSVSTGSKILIVAVAGACEWLVVTVVVVLLSLASHSTLMSQWV